MTIESLRAPSIRDAAKILGVDPASIDEGFGVIPIDPDRNLYSVRVEAAAVTGKDGGDDGDYRGPFSDPKIAPMR